MKTPRDSLSESLQRWRVTPPSDPGFRAAVWARIRAAGGRESWPAFVRAHAAAWAVAAVVTLGTAGYGGYAVARARAAADREAIVVTYLTGLDPRAQAVLRP
jgi:hypothetical protein